MERGTKELLELRKKGNYLGRTGEEGRKTVFVDATKWNESAGGGSGILLYTSPTGQVWPLGSVTETDEETGTVKISAPITRAETAVAGNGHIEAQWMSGGEVVKSVSYNTLVLESAYTGETVPDNTPHWVKELIEELNAAGVLLEELGEVASETRSLYEEIQAPMAAVQEALTTADEIAERAQAAATTAQEHKTAAAASASAAAASAEQAMTATPEGYAAFVGSMAQAYSPAQAYAVGDLALKDGQLYRCVSAIGEEGEAWTEGHWTAVTVGGEVGNLKTALSDTNDALEIIFAKNLCTGVQENTRYSAWNDGDAITISTDASYIGAIIPLNGEEYISTNQNWCGPSYSFFADSEDKRISRVVDGKTEDPGYVYAVPQNAVKIYMSQNVANVNASRGLVVFNGKADLTGDEFTATNYPYNTQIAHIGVLDHLMIEYANIKNQDINEADGTYTAMSNATVSGNTATVTAAYSGMRCNEFSLTNSYAKISVKPIFNVPGVVMRFQANVNGTWKTVSGIEWVLNNNSENDVAFKPADYVSGATKYRLIFQNTGLTDNVTNTITIESLSIYDAKELETYPLYDSNLEELLTNVLNAMSGIKRVYHVEKDGSGDFVSFVDAIAEATKYMDSVVYVGAGTYNLMEELGNDYIQNPSSSKKGIVLKNRVHVICSSQTIFTINNTGAVLEYLSTINTGKYGCTLENATIIDNGVRYSIHDDLGGSGPTPYINRFINCTIIHKNGMYGDCIGGGLGENGEIEIRGCYFEGDSGVERLVYYHGNNNPNVTNAKCHLVIADNYFANNGTFKMTKYGQSTEVSTALVSNNSFGSLPSVDSGSVAPYDNVAIIAWNNEIRYN